jgi:hypothetical protein
MTEAVHEDFVCFRYDKHPDEVRVAAAKCIA